ncbi:uncharacterized protein GGS22DRAFT_198377 [Annulohypoxylon maeteangense]|uniref:uncharacterized protein n=1 Tax=Annulohypoxylon maeteangense TaxID=1927788 RepID=UPI0020087126|nr:uncharacterized protein GGS22DRAFT_198377 [Annulohypoxylon maeteangense]KAI0880055.1 hypothetical protein GGS22DRAFT_198377 [Annulohypoxylon maeteangense]
MTYQFLPETTSLLTPDTVPIFPLVFTAVCVIPALVIGVSTLWYGTETSAHSCFMTGLRFFAIGFAYMIIGVFSVPILGLHYVDNSMTRERELVEEEDETEVQGLGLEIESVVEMDGGNVTAGMWERRTSVALSDASQPDLDDIQPDVFDTGEVKKNEETGWNEVW